MTREENIRAILKCNFVGYEEEIIDNAVKRIHELEQAPCSDCVSREEAMTEIQMNARRYTIAKEFGGMGQVEWSDNLIAIKDALDILRKMPSVKQEPKTGEWIKQNDDYFDWYECSECGYGGEGEMQYSSEYDVRTNYCPNCGCRMESEVDNGNDNS